MDKILNRFDNHGGIEKLRVECEQSMACNSKNYLPLLWEFFASKRATLFQLLRALDIHSATQNDILIQAMRIMLNQEAKKAEYLSIDVDLSFTTEQWRRLIIEKEGKNQFIARRHFEVCVFSHLANELRSGDLFIVGAGSFADYRQELLSLTCCQELLNDYCKEVGIPPSSQAFVQWLRHQLAQTAQRIDQQYPDIAELIIDEQGNPVLKKREPKRKTVHAAKLFEEVRYRIPERNILDILCNTHHYAGWAHEFGPISGSEAKLDNPIERYILTNFAYGTCMGPTQAAQHIRADITAHMLSWINRRHITPIMLDKARTRLINFSNTFNIITTWGDGKSCAADGNLRLLREENLIVEFHMRYSQKGGIAYHHVANNYIALFSTFIPCGVWEAVEIIEALLRNDSDIQPHIIHADTQGQSTVVFALAFLLGIKLMPRRRCKRLYYLKYIYIHMGY